MTTDNISTFLWFHADADKAVKLYCEIFANAKVTDSSPMATSFELAGQRYIAFNGGPTYTLSAAVSIMVQVDTQAEIDEVWNKFIASGGKESRCGWLVDAFGLSWQIIPKKLTALIGDPDRVKGKRALDAMMTMSKIDLAALEKAHAG